MPTYVLESNTPTRISAGPVRLQIHASDVTGPVSPRCHPDPEAYRTHRRVRIAADNPCLS
jgi:hypothetical protein